MTNTPAQAQEKSYALHSLGWKAFQDLCITITSDILGQIVQKFSSNKDGGRDGAFHGSWNMRIGAGVTGSFTVQCKYTNKSDDVIKLSTIRISAANYLITPP